MFPVTRPRKRTWPMLNTCHREYPSIRCGGNGCICDLCGLPERINIDDLLIETKKEWNMPVAKESNGDF